MPAYKLKITLDESKPKITRTVAVPDHASLADLHSIIQSVMGWQDYHLHRFIVDDREYLPIYDEDRTPDTGIEEWTPLSDLEGEKIHYNYDYGDDWWITVSWLKGIESYDLPWPELLDWREDSPPEDCGGVRGYYDLLRILADPTDERHRDMKEWAGDLGFDEETVENSLQSWPPQGVMPRECTPLPHMARMGILLSFMALPHEPTVFDLEEMMPLILKERRPRKSKKRGPEPELPAVSPAEAEKHPERYIPLAGPGMERSMAMLHSFAEQNPKVKWPDASNDNESAYIDAIETNGLVDRYGMHCLITITRAINDWAHEHGIYFIDMPVLPAGPAESFAKYMHEHEEEIDFDDEESVQKFIDEYNSQLRK